MKRVVIVYKDYLIITTTLLNMFKDVLLRGEGGTILLRVRRRCH